LAEIVHITEGVDWEGYYAFQSVMRERTQELVSPAAIVSIFNGPLFTMPVGIDAPLQGNDNLQGLDIEELTSLLSHG